MQDGQKRAKKFRAQRKLKLEKACKNNPDLLNQLKLRTMKCRLSIEDNQSEFLKHILNIAMAGAAAQQKDNLGRSIEALTLDFDG
jgi:hypothetical protein